MMLFEPPVCPMLLVSPFGPRPPPNGPMHVGIDLSAYGGQAIYAAAPGVVIASYYSANDPRDWEPGDPPPKVMGYGGTVVIQHEDGYRTRYAHMLSRSVAKGEQVAVGQQVGLAGSEGYSFGVHLHFEVWKHPGYVDPETMLPPVTRLGKKGHAHG